MSGRHARISRATRMVLAGVYSMWQSPPKSANSTSAPIRSPARRDSASRISGVPLLPASPLESTQILARLPRRISLIKMAAHPNSTSSGWAPIASSLGGIRGSQRFQNITDFSQGYPADRLPHHLAENQMIIPMTPQQIADSGPLPAHPPSAFGPVKF